METRSTSTPALDGSSRSPRLCLSVSSFHEEFVGNRLTVAGFLRIARENGFAAVEVCDRSVPFGGDAIDAVVDACGTHRLAVACYDIRNDFTLRDPAQLSVQIEHVIEGIVAASRLGSSVARIWLGCSATDEDAFRRVCGALRQVVPAAERHRVRLAVENHGGLSDDPDMLLRIIDFVESPYLGACPDFGRLDPRRRVADLRALLPYAFHCHAKSHRFDSDGRECDIDYCAIGAVLREGPYRGCVSIEYEGDGTDRMDGVMKTAALIERHFLSVPASVRPTEVPPLAFPTRSGVARVSPPYIQRCRSENVWPAARAAVRDFVAALAAHGETVGIAAIGGLADTDGRRFIDRTSDLDFAVFISIPQATGYLCPKTFARERPELLPAWVPNFEFQMAVDGISMEGNCHQLIMEIEENGHVRWPISKQEAYRHTGELLYDPTGRVAALIQAKCTTLAESEYAITAASQLPWYGWINPARQAARGFPETGHILINHGLEILLELLFLSNGRLPPHLKWSFESASDLPWAPRDFRQRFLATLEERSLDSRIDLMRALGDEVLSRMHDQGLLPADPFRYASIYIDRDRQLRPRPREASRDY